MIDQPLIQATGLTRVFQGPHGEVRAVDGVDLAVHPGDLLAVYGRSGTGKTTLLLVLGGLLAPQGGTVQVLGRDLYALPPGRRSSCRAQHIGYVFQEFHLVPYLTVLDNVLVPSLALPGRKDIKDRARSLLDRFQLGHRLDHVPSALSAGEQQRVALARALVLSPRVVLADEPTGNLDAENGEIVLGALRDFVGAGGAVVLVTHDRDGIQAASRRMRMAHGALQADETAGTTSPGG